MEEKININNQFKSKNEPILILKIESLHYLLVKS